MNIIKLTASNFKRLKAVSLKPSTGVNKVSGKNAQGKTSLFDAIRVCVGGAKLTESKPVREGEEKAVVELDLGDIVVKRSLTAKGGNTVTIKAKDGSTVKQPQDVLNKLYNKIAFNLMKFIQMTGKEQYGLLKDVLGVGDKIEQMESAYQELYDERTVANRIVKETSARLKGIELDDLVGYDKTSINDVIIEMEDAVKHNNGIEQHKRDIEAYEKAITDNKQAIAHNLQEIENLKEGNKRLEAKSEEHRIAIENKKTFNFETIETQPIKDKMNRLEETNAIVDQNVKHRELAKEVKTKELAAKDIDTKMVKISQEITATMDGLKMPIAELTMANGDVLYKNVPVDQISASEKLKVSMAIAMALNPEMKVILITDASLFDAASMAEVEKIAEENGYQIWLELVDDSGQVGIVIEDGSVVATKDIAKEGA